MELVIVPVAHISRKSVEKVRETILNERPDAIAVELCETRLRAMLRQKTSVRSTDMLRNPLYVIFYVIQRSLGEIFRIKPGSEMFEAVKLASELKIPLFLVDRDINQTMGGLNAISLKEKLFLLLQGPLSLPFFVFKLPKNLEELTSQESVEKVMLEFKAHFPSFYKVLVNERDHYMANQVTGINAEKVVLVVGAGHVKGLSELITSSLIRIV